MNSKQSSSQSKTGATPPPLPESARRTGGEQPPPDANADTTSDAAPDGDTAHGEGSYTGTRDYQKSVKNYLRGADVEDDARQAAPENADVERELEDAEQEGLSHARGERDSRSR